MTYKLSALLITLSIISSTSNCFALTPKFEVIKTIGVSAQQLFLGSQDTVYIIDKTEGNPLKVNGHPVWAAEYNFITNQTRPLDIRTNSFCANGAPLADGSWINVGGNTALGINGVAVNATSNPYDAANGGSTVRKLMPCTDANCQISETDNMSSNRWYPTVETLDDGSAIILGGQNDGTYSGSPTTNNPTYEYWPSKGAQRPIDLLKRTVPINLYPLTFLLKSGKLFMNAYMENIIFDHINGQETSLPAMPHAQRCYPASAGTAVLPLTPQNNYTATIIFCGGQNFTAQQWGGTDPGTNVLEYTASNKCDRITPQPDDDSQPQWEEDDDLFVGRSMGQFVFLPDGRLWFGNGVEKGTAGYTTLSWAVGQSCGDDPVMQPYVYDPNAPKGSRFSIAGSPSSVPRLYHSSATLLPDGSILVAGSNPNTDVSTEKWATEYQVEKWYPDYYDSPRPSNAGLPNTLSYGGNYTTIALNNTDLNNNGSNLAQATVWVHKTGFSTHAVNFGMRALQLNTTYSMNSDKVSGNLYVSPPPPNPAIFPPGPALMFLIVDGVPSVGKMVMVGNGKVGVQPVEEVVDLPATSIPPDPVGSTLSSPTGSVTPNKSFITLPHSQKFLLPLLISLFTFTSTF